MISSHIVFELLCVAQANPTPPPALRGAQLTRHRWAGKAGSSLHQERRVSSNNASSAELFVLVPHTGDGELALRSSNIMGVAHVLCFVFIS